MIALLVTQAWGAPPVVTVQQPVAGGDYRAGDRIWLSGVVADPDTFYTRLRVGWGSTRDGVLFTGTPAADGTVVTTVQLTQGVHWIGLGATDPQNGRAGARVRISVAAANRAPTVATVAVSPAVLTAADPSATCTAQRVADLDGDSVTLAYRWTIDGVDRGTGATLAGPFTRGQSVACAVTPSDSRTRGTEVASAVSVIANTAPTVTAVGIEPPAPLPRDVVRCAILTDDLDGDAVTTTVRWTLDGAPAGVGDELAGPFTVGQQVACTATASDGTDAGPPAGAATAVVDGPVPGNILLVIADDVGADNIALFGTGSAYPLTPRIDTLASQGVVFQRTYSNSVCSPTRATIMTGRYGWRTGVTEALPWANIWPLQLAETTIPEMLDAETGGAYDNSYIGKWHLATRRVTLATNPNDQGWNWYAGTLTGFGADADFDGLTQDYFDWEKTTNGVPARTTNYATVDTADDAITRMGAMTEPWILVVAFNSAHTPVHIPPVALVSGQVSGSSTAARKYNAMIEALDHEMGRVLDAMPPDVSQRTTVMFVGDNGAWDAVISAPLDPTQGKETAYEGASHVPFVVAGPLVSHPGTVVDALVNTTDLFATIGDLAGVTVDPTHSDSTSVYRYLRDPDLAPLRDYAYVEQLSPIGRGPWTTGFHTIRDDRWKLTEFVDGSQKFYDLEGVAHEGPDLLLTGLTPEQEAARARLEAAFPIAFP